MRPLRRRLATNAIVRGDLLIASASSQSPPLPRPGWPAVSPSGSAGSPRLTKYSTTSANYLTTDAEPDMIRRGGAVDHPAGDETALTL
jgi:hypothetical protein